MATAVTSITLDTPAIDFRLPATDGRTYTWTMSPAKTAR